MSFELTGPAAILCVESDSTFVVRRGEQTVAALLRVFIETYSVRFPVISAGAPLNDGRKCECAFETNWKNIEVAFEATAEADGFRLVWSIPHTAGSVGVGFSLAQGGPWYGMGERLIQSWPRSKLIRVTYITLHCEAWHGPRSASPENRWKSGAVKALGC